MSHDSNGNLFFLLSDFSLNQPHQGQQTGGSSDYTRSADYEHEQSGYPNEPNDEAVDKSIKILSKQLTKLAKLLKDTSLKVLKYISVINNVR